MDSQYSAPQGMDSQYSAPQGMDSQYSAPQGMYSQYSAPQVMYSQYSAPPGIALQYSAQPGMESQYNDPQGPQYSALPGMAPQGMGINPAGRPSGLAYLATLNEVRVHQIVNIIELVNWRIQENNQYEIRNSNNQKFMFAQENTDERTREYYGTERPFAITVRDNFGNPVMLVNRPFCDASCLWCYLQEIEIQSPPGVLQGTVKPVWKFCTPKYRAYNSQNQCVFTIMGECCSCKYREDEVFRVFDGDREEKEVAQIVKHYGGYKERYTGATDFILRFMTDLDLMQKILLLGATFLIDFNLFEERSHRH